MTHSLSAQPVNRLTGIVKSATTLEPLPGASITIYSPGKISGMVANKDGKFVLAAGVSFDSIKVSMVGHDSKLYFPGTLDRNSFIEVMLKVAPAELQEVVIKPLSAMDVIRKAIAAIPAHQPQQNFENRGFYREIIKDRENYFSVAEAVFTAQYYPAKKEFKLRLERGRSKEDVAYTRLFEDFHPGGGPQAAANNSFLTERPTFLNIKEINNFIYKIDSVVFFDGRKMHSISFDQKPAIKKALEKGTILVDIEDFAIVRFEAENSPFGTPYIKDLAGSDKIAAEILNIDFQRKGWKRRANFTRVNEKWLLNFAETEYAIGYKQPKKNLDLDLTISIELVFTDLLGTIERSITREEEWKRKNIVANLPTAFDSSFWGGNNVISPTEDVKNIIESLSKSEGDLTHPSPISDWQYLNQNLFVAYKRTDTITMVPVMKSVWEDDESAGMIFRQIKGDFTIESKITLRKNSDINKAPDRGFQQGGIIVRSYDYGEENYVLLSVGTGGNPNLKLFFKRTVDNRSKTVVERKELMDGWLRIEKSGKKISAYYKEQTTDVYKTIGEYNLAWLEGKLQLGFAVFAAFAGDGPRMQPDIRVSFSAIKIESQ